MPRLMFVAALAVCTLTAPVLAAEMRATPYAGQQTRTIKALSDDEIAALRNGEGMGMIREAAIEFGSNFDSSVRERFYHRGDYAGDKPAMDLGIRQHVV